MTRVYYPYWYRLDGMDAFLIWFTNSHDGVWVDAQGLIPSFQTLAQLQSYAAAHQIPIDNEVAMLHDLDVVATWLKRPLSADIDCDSFLAAWNLFSNVSAAINGDFDPDHARTTGVYDKLFYGNNLPVITPPGEHYEPEWTDDEVLLIRELLAGGLQLFREHVQPIE
jgi:hypothetical protein